MGRQYSINVSLSIGDDHYTMVSHIVHLLCLTVPSSTSFTTIFTYLHIWLGCEPVFGSISIMTCLIYNCIDAETVVRGLVSYYNINIILNKVVCVTEVDTIYSYELITLFRSDTLLTGHSIFCCGSHTNFACA